MDKVRRVFKVCGDCWHIIRPDEYEPNGGTDGECDRCGQWYFACHRVSRQEVEQA